MFDLANIRLVYSYQLTPVYLLHMPLKSFVQKRNKAENIDWKKKIRPINFPINY